MTNRLPSHLHNQYYGLRHGESQANVKGLIVSDLKNDSTDYGLTLHGESNVVQQIKRMPMSKETLIFSSPFVRCQQTAELAHQGWGTAPVEVEPALRERYFGEFEKGSNEAYNRVWALDSQCSDHQEFGVESVASVCERMVGLIIRLEQLYSKKSILFVSHGDSLQILMTCFSGVPSTTHRLLEHWQPGEIRPFTL